MSASPHSERELEVIGDLARIYGLDYGTHGYRFWESGAGQGDEPAVPEEPET
jgi:hypothetical protein